MITDGTHDLTGVSAALLNLGCKVNAYETEAMRQQLKLAGARIVEFGDVADIYVINTCTVTGIADRKSRQMLHRAKKQNENAIVVAAGCYAQEAASRLAEDKSVDVIIGNQDKNRLVSLVCEYMETKRGCFVRDMKEAKSFEPLGDVSVQENTRAYIKIQDGCNQFCSYCIIPYVRGRIRSRDEEDILEEAGNLAASGYKEIVLTGIHISSYGFDKVENKGIPTDEDKAGEWKPGGLGRLHSDGPAPLAGLILRLSSVQGIERIRLGSLEPRIVTEEFVKCISENPKVCPHFHLSLQSGCDETLRRMNRKYTTYEYTEGVRLLESYFERPAITTDVIVGFPGETEDEFEITRRFLQKTGFSQLHIFQYAKREGTRAAAMGNQIAEEVKQQRSRELIELSEGLNEAYLSGFIGRRENVIFEERMKNRQEYFVGHNERYVKIAIRTDEDISGRLVCVHVTGFLEAGVLEAIVAD